jgi:hypothetical protein
LKMRHRATVVDRHRDFCMGTSTRRARACNWLVAKAKVAGSNPVFRSKYKGLSFRDILGRGPLVPGLRIDLEQGWNIRSHDGLGAAGTDSRAAFYSLAALVSTFACRRRPTGGKPCPIC